MVLQPPKDNCSGGRWGSIHPIPSVAHLRNASVSGAGYRRSQPFTGSIRTISVEVAPATVAFARQGVVSYRESGSRANCLMCAFHCRPSIQTQNGCHQKIIDLYFDLGMKYHSFLYALLPSEKKYRACCQGANHPGRVGDV